MTKESNATEQDEVRKAGAQWKIEKSTDFRSYYTNFLQATFTPFDVSFVIGQATGIDPETQRWTAELNARLTMSAAEAKVVLIILANTIKAYEQQFGKIIVPPAALNVDLGSVEADEVDTEGV